MLISYYEDGVAAPKKASMAMAGLMVVNAVMSAGIVFAWTFVSLFVAEPLAWATWMPINRGYGLFGLVEYPFVLLWIVPLLGICGAWVSLKAGRRALAFTFVALPIGMLALVLGWYHLAPQDWH